jgi:uncharacterized protein with PQ loop repeat
MIKLEDWLDLECWLLLSITLRLLGPAFFLGVQFSLFKTALTIRKRGSVGEFSIAPFLSILLNGLTWSFYGFLKKDMTLFVPNFTGFLVGLSSTIIFDTYVGVDGRPRVLYAFSATLGLISIVLCILGDLETLGLVGVCLSILLMGSPLSTAMTVIKDKSTASMPFNTSLFSFCNGMSWTLYGYLIDKDAMIYVSSGVGLLLTIVQLSLYAIYGLPPAADTEKPPHVRVTYKKSNAPFSPLPFRNVFYYPRTQPYSRTPLQTIDESHVSYSATV